MPMPLQRTKTMAYPVVSPISTTSSISSTTPSRVAITTMAPTIGSTSKSRSETNNNTAVYNQHTHGSSSSSFYTSTSSSTGTSYPSTTPTTSDTPSHLTTAMPVDKSSTTRAIPLPQSNSPCPDSLGPRSNHNTGYSRLGLGGMLRVVYKDTNNINTTTNGNRNYGGPSDDTSTPSWDLSRSQSEPLPDDSEENAVDVDMGDDTAAGSQESGTVTPRQQQLWRSQSAYDIRPGNYTPLHQALGFINGNANINAPRSTTHPSATPLSRQEEDDAMEDVLSSDEYSDSNDDGPGTNGEEDDEYGIDNMDDITPSQQDDWALLLSQHPDPPSKRTTSGSNQRPGSNIHLNATPQPDSANTITPQPSQSQLDSKMTTTVGTSRSTPAPVKPTLTNTPVINVEPPPTTQSSLGLGPAPSRALTPSVQQSQRVPLNRKLSVAATEILDPEPQDIVKELKGMGIKVRDYAYFPRARRVKAIVPDDEISGKGGDESLQGTEGLSEKAKGKQKADDLSTTESVAIPIPPSSNPAHRMNLPFPKVPLEIFEPYKCVTEVDYRWSLPTARRQAQGPVGAIPGKILHHLLEIGWLSRTEMWARANEHDLKSLEKYLAGVERWRNIVKKGEFCGTVTKRAGDEGEGEEEEEVLSVHAFHPQPYPWVSLHFNSVPSLEERRDLLNVRRTFWMHMDEMRDASVILERREKMDRRTGREGRRKANMMERAVLGFIQDSGDGGRGNSFDNEERGKKRRAEEDDETVPSPSRERHRSVSVNGRKRRRTSPKPESRSANCVDENDEEDEDEYDDVTPRASQAQVEGDNEDADGEEGKEEKPKTSSQSSKRDKTPESETSELPTKNRYVNPFQGLENVVHIHPSSDVGPLSQLPASGDDEADPYKGLTEEERRHQIELDEEEEEYQREMRESLREMVIDCAGVDGENGVKRRWWELEMSELRRGGVGRNAIVRKRVGEPPKHMYSFNEKSGDADNADGVGNGAEGEDAKDGSGTEHEPTKETKIRTNAMLDPYAGDKEDEVDPKTFTYKTFFKKPERYTRAVYPVYKPPKVQQMQQWANVVRRAQKEGEMSPFVQNPGVAGIGNIFNGGTTSSTISAPPLERTDTPPLSEAEQAANEAIANRRRSQFPERSNNSTAAADGSLQPQTGRGRGLTRSYTNEGMPGGLHAGRGGGGGGEMPLWGVAPSLPASKPSAFPGHDATRSALASSASTLNMAGATRQPAPFRRSARALGRTTTFASLPIDPQVNLGVHAPVTRSMSVRGGVENRDEGKGERENKSVTGEEAEKEDVEEVKNGEDVDTDTDTDTESEGEGEDTKADD